MHEPYFQITLLNRLYHISFRPRYHYKFFTLIFILNILKLQIGINKVKNLQKLSLGSCYVDLASELFYVVVEYLL